MEVDEEAVGRTNQIEHVQGSIELLRQDVQDDEAALTKRRNSKAWPASLT